MQIELNENVERSWDSFCFSHSGYVEDPDTRRSKNELILCGCRVPFLGDIGNKEVLPYQALKQSE